MKHFVFSPVGLLFCAIFISRAFGQTLADPGELERLRAENRELRTQLRDAQAKLKAAQPSPTPTPTVGPAKPARSPIPPSATEDAPLLSQNFLNKIFLRRTVFSEEVLNLESISRPAQFTFEHSGHGSDSYAIDTGIAAEFKPIQIMTFQIDPGAGVDYHRNSSSDSAKNLLQAGVIADSIFGDPALSDFFAHVKGNVTFKDDEHKGVKSVSGGLDLLPVEKKIFKIDDSHDFAFMRWRWQPFAGLRWSVSGEVPDDANNGHQVLARYGLESHVFPLYAFANVKESLDATLNLTAWSDLSSSGVYRSKAWRGYLDFEFNYWFYGGPSRTKDKTSLGFGLGYEKGDNPDSDQTDLDLLTLSLRAKF